MQSLKKFLEKRLKLKVNETKSGCAVVDERKFLGYRLLSDGKLIIADVSVERIRNKIRRLTQRNRGISLEEVIFELNVVLRGWINYFGLTQKPSELKNLDKWIRRKLRCYRLKQRKSAWSIAKFLMNLGVRRINAWNVAKSGKGWWRLSSSVPIQQAMNNKWFEEQGLVNLINQRALLNV